MPKLTDSLSQLLQRQINERGARVSGTDGEDDDVSTAR